MSCGHIGSAQNYWPPLLQVKNNSVGLYTQHTKIDWKVNNIGVANPGNDPSSKNVNRFTSCPQSTALPKHSVTTRHDQTTSHMSSGIKGFGDHSSKGQLIQSNAFTRAMLIFKQKTWSLIFISIHPTIISVQGTKDENVCESMWLTNPRLSPFTKELWSVQQSTLFTHARQQKFKPSYTNPEPKPES